VNEQNLRPVASEEEAREKGRRGGIASGEARRKKASLRAELEMLLTMNDGAVAKSIAVSMCREAKNGSVAAFKAIAQMIGEMSEFIEVPEMPPPVVIAVHDPAFVEAERERQRREFAELAEAAVIDLKPTGTGSGETWGPTGASSPQDAGNGPADALPAGVKGAESQETGTGAAQTRPGGAEASAEGSGREARQSASNAPSAKAPPEPPPQPRIPRTPSEAAAMRREAERRDRAARGEPDGPRPYRAVPVTFPRR
jgi:hypothetical protein